MSTEEKMTIYERYKYLRMMHKRYRKAGRPERSQLLDEMQIVSQLHRKSLMRLMRGKLIYGISPAGLYLHSLQMLDVATGWSERVAMLVRSFLVLKEGFERILPSLLFGVLEIRPDNGSEFLNDLLIGFWEKTLIGVEISRSRPYQKNRQSLR